jgi:UPF0755 protein
MASSTTSRGTLRFILAGIVIVSTAVVAFLLYAFFWPNMFPDQSERFVHVSRGATFHAIMDSLERGSIIRSRFLFHLTARVYGGTERLQVGKYVFLPGMSNAEIFLSMREGRNNELIAVTIPEGLRARSQARLFARALGIDSVRYIRLVHDPGFVRTCGLEGPTLEGYLLPDTYRLMWDQDETEIIQKQVEEFKRFFTDSLRDRAGEFGWTVREAVTFASIVEGEAVLDDERPVIAGVYHNRLRIGMKLEADPTLQYIFDTGPRRVLYADLRIANPYNTYLYPGLPPGPVNNPGKASMLATLYPQQHRYLFFVANTHGGHWFARTYAEHVQNVRKYRRARTRR